MDENKKQENIKTIHTYSSDMVDAVRENEVSVIKIALAEQKKKEQEALYKQAEGTNTSKVFLLIGGLFIILASIFGIYYLMQKKNTKNTPVETTKNIEALVSYDEQSFLDMTSATSATDTAGIVQDEIKKGSKVPGIKSLFLTKNITGKPELLSLDDLLSITKITAPSSLIRSLGSNYMVGTYQSSASGEVPHLFLLFQTKDYNQSYAGMLGWEKTLLDDLFILFHIDVSGDRSTLFDNQWKDIIISNTDARVLYDDKGNTVLYYMFLDKDNFVITESKDAIKEIANRLLAKKVKPL